jgi:hypothetical protein
MPSKIRSLIRNNCNHSWPYLVIVLFVLSYYYFFTEKLPWFWYDDILRIEWAEKLSVPATFQRVFNFTSLTFGIDRPVFAIYIKICNFFFGENPHSWRIIKIILFSITVCCLFYLNMKHGGNRFIAILALCVFSTFPSVVIGNVWISDSESLELFFTVISFIVFFKLVSEPEGKVSLRFILLSVFLLLFIILADESKVTAIITPFILVSYLLITRNRNIPLYIVMFLSILTVFPYAVFSGNAFLYTSTSTGYLTNEQYMKLLRTFIAQTWLMFIFILTLVIIVKKRGYLKNQYVLFSGLWLIYEILFYIFYPSNEMRYLFSSLAAAIVLLSSLISLIFKNIPQGKLLKIAKYGFTVILLFLLSSNTVWSYSFRGSMDIIILADKEMEFINRNYKNSLCLYEERNRVYYTRNASNNLYVNIHAKYADSPENRGIYTVGAEGLAILHPEKYENIFFLVTRDSQLKYCYSSPGLSFDSEIPNSIYDSFQKRMNFSIYSANLYNTTLNNACRYPAYGDICKLK